MKRQTQRKSTAEREAEIVEQAIRYFADVGPDGTTHELARRIGVTQPLLYKYFRTKQDLLDRVYEELYVNRWNADWDRILDAATPDFCARLTRFYKSYARSIFESDWLRIFLATVMKGEDVVRSRAYMVRVEDRIITPICTGTRRHFGLPGPDQVPINGLEREIAWNLHGGIFYTGVRRFVYGMALHHDLDAAIEANVERHLHGLEEIIARAIRQPS